MERIESAKIQSWLARDPDPQTRLELQALVERDDTAELQSRFGGRLAFGTAGLRGVLGAGPGRMNQLVVRETTAGLGAYLLRTTRHAKERGVVVGFDGRRNSRVFAEDTASVLGAQGIKVFLFDREAPTPVAAFAVRHLRAAAGVVITASHNPPEYNGYKVYWGNGAQIIPPHDAGIAAAIEAAAGAPLPWADCASLRRQGLTVSLGDKVENAYLEAIGKLSNHKARGTRARLVIAYTPLHGVGARAAGAALERAGFTQVHMVTSQKDPNGAFPTVRFPNPEEPGAMDAVMALARDTHAELACANDPDADRFAVAVRRSDGSYRLLTGNEVGVLLGDDLLRKKRLSKRALVGTTIVSSRLLGRIAAARGVTFFETLTGFKWLANSALARRGSKLLFAYEEALGYGVGEVVRDKDGISALVAFAELTCACQEAGESLWQRLESIHRTYGLYATGQRTLALQSQAGPSLGERLRQRPPQQIAGRKVQSVRDLMQVEANAAPDSLPMPPSDVLMYTLEDDARVIVRPSGTEPKIKCYYEAHTQIASNEPYEQADARIHRDLDELMHKHQDELASF